MDEREQIKSKREEGARVGHRALGGSGEANGFKPMD